MARDFELLQPSERERAARFHFDADRRVYVGAHGLLRRALSQHAPVRCGRLAFFGERGAASRDRAADALAASSVQPFAHAIGRGLRHHGRARRRSRHRGPDPRGAVRGGRSLRALRAERVGGSRCRRARGSGSSRTGRSKEAYIKARGLGLALPLDQLPSTSRTATSKYVSATGCPDDRSAWRFEIWRVDDACRAALAVKTKQELEVLRVNGRGERPHPGKPLVAPSPDASLERSRLVKRSERDREEHS